MKNVRVSESTYPKALLSKSSLFFSPNCNQHLKDYTFNLLSIPRTNNFGKYLEIETEFGISKKRVFENIKEKVSKRISNWSNSFLDHSGREILIKSVLQALPSYIMSCYQIPINTLEDIIKDIRDFFWNKQTHWAKWDDLCNPTAEGGLGFKNLKVHNEALLAKTGWRIIKEPNTLLSKILKAKYFNNSNFMEASVGHRASWGWRSILKGREILKLGLRWKVGNGNSINAITDPWIPKPWTFKPYININTPNIYVNEFINHELQWDTHKLFLFFSEEDTNIIKEIPINTNLPSDKLVWHHNPSGLYSVKSGYDSAIIYYNSINYPSTSNPIHQDPNSNFNWNSIGKIKAQRKIRSFVWRALSNNIATKSNLFHRNLSDSNLCELCNNSIESVNHCLFQCNHARATWLLSPINLDTNSFNSEDFKQNWIKFISNISNLDEKQFNISTFTYTLWAIWKARNNFYFNNITPDPLATANTGYNWSTEFRYTWDVDSPTIMTGWTPPPPGKLKLNTDASWDPISGESHAGWLLRDHRNKFIAGGSSKKRIFNSPILAEAEALLFALNQCPNNLINNFIIESDAKILINTILNNNNDHAEIYDTVENIKVVTSVMGLGEFNHAPRACNSSAHSIAASASGSARDFFWMDRAPPC